MSDAGDGTRERAEVDFDHHSKEFADHRHEEWARIRRCPVAYNPRYGGFWVVSGHPEVAAVARDGATYSSRYVEHADDGIDYLGIMGVPRMQGVPPALIAEVEGPVHVAIRRALNPFLLPPAVAAARPFLEQCATWFLDQVIEDGHMDVVSDFTNPIPAVFTMRLLGLPPESWTSYAEVFHAINAHRADAPERVAAQALVPDMLAQVVAVAAERRRDPREDILSALVALEVEDGRHLSDAELTGILWNFIGGGLDTTTSLTSLSLALMDERPALRAALVDDPSLLGSATEEFLRYTSVNETLTRTVVADAELGGEQLRRGEPLMMSWLSANFDERVFEAPEEIVLDRAPNPHLAFGVGPHRCIGMHVARELFAVMLRELLARVPDITIDRAGTRFYERNPELAGVIAMPATFTPGPTSGTERPF